MSGIRRVKNTKPRMNNNNSNNSNGYHHHHHHGLRSMPSKQEMVNLPVLDLHGCFKQDAKRKVTDFLEQQAARANNNNNNSRSTSGLLLCKIVTGTGAHSSATGGPILRTAVENLLNKREMHYDAKSYPGAFIVDAGTGIVLENRACTSEDTKILVAHAEDEAVILQRAAQQQGKRRAAQEQQTACARSNNGLHSSSSSLNNTATLDLLSGPSIHEVAEADKALEWAQVESRKAYQEHHQTAKRDSQLVEKAISLSLRDDSLSFSNHHDDDTDHDDDKTWQEELETALKISQQETSSTENVHEKIKLALQESARLEEERREMEQREMQELEMVLRLSQLEQQQQQQQHEEETKELLIVGDDGEDLELERALLESVRLQELETALRQQAGVEAQEQAARQQQVELETLATIERQRQLEQQIALDRQQELEKQALALEKQWQREELKRQFELEKQAALELQRELDKQAAAHLEKQHASALRIQATVRGYQCRLITCEMRTRVVDAIVLVKKYWRRRLAFLRYQQHQRRTASATLIQSVSRSYQCRRLILVSQDAEKEADRRRQQEEEENETLAMALQQEENEKTEFALQHLCAETEDVRDEDQKRLRIALSLSQHDAGETRSGGLGWQENAIFKRQEVVEKQATSGCQNVEKDLEILAACMQQPYNSMLMENGYPGTQSGAVEVEENAGKGAPSELKDSRGQLKRAPENASQSTPSLPPRACFKAEPEEEQEWINQRGGPPSGTAKLPPASIPQQQNSRLKPSPAPGPKSPQGGRLERAPGEQGKSSNRNAAMNTLKQAPGEATRQDETLGRTEPSLLVQDSAPSGYAMQFPERRESSKSKKDTKALDQAILEASRSKQANLLADFLSRSF